MYNNMQRVNIFSDKNYKIYTTVLVYYVNHVMYLYIM